MAHNILGERFIGARQPAWHGLGQVFEDSPTAVEAGERAGAMFNIFEQPVFFGMSVGNGEMAYFPVPGQKALVRDILVDDPEYRPLAIVGEDYGLLQNRRILEIMDGLTEKWPVETLGVLGQGEGLFVTLDAGEREIKGELLKLYYLLSEKRTGSWSLRACFTPVRVVCQNTETLGLKAAVVNAALPHRATLDAELSFRTKIMAQMEKSQEDVLASFEKLMSFEIEDEDAQRVFTAAYPLPLPSAKMIMGEVLDMSGMDADFAAKLITAQSVFEANTEAAKGKQAAARVLYSAFNDNFPQVAATPWAATQAVTELEDWREGRNPEMSILFGDRAKAKARAFDAALKLCE
jgi:phage/plasmid-like protein (TIGR03299 family)